MLPSQAPNPLAGPFTGATPQIIMTLTGVKQFAQQAVWNLLDAHDAILEHRIEQTHYSNKSCKPGIEYQINDLVYLSTKNLALPKHRA